MDDNLGPLSDSDICGGDSESSDSSGDSIFDSDDDYDYEGSEHDNGEIIASDTQSDDDYDVVESPADGDYDDDLYSEDDDTSSNEDVYVGENVTLLRWLLIVFFRITSHFNFSNNAISAILSFISLLLGMIK